MVHMCITHHQDYTGPCLQFLRHWLDMYLKAVTPAGKQLSGAPHMTLLSSTMCLDLKELTVLWLSALQVGFMPRVKSFWNLYKGPSTSLKLLTYLLLFCQYIRCNQFIPCSACHLSPDVSTVNKLNYGIATTRTIFQHHNLSQMCK